MTADQSSSASLRLSPNRTEVKEGAAGGFSRRRFLGYLIAAPTVMAAAQVGADLRPAPASASIPSPPEPSDVADNNDFLTWAAAPTSNLISVQVNTDGTASFALPRAEVGQGITTAIAMLIAEEMDLPLERVRISLADARPELVWNQLTGNSNSMFSLYTPVRTAAALARQQLLAAAAAQWRVPVSSLTTHDGVITAPDGRTLTYGSLAAAAAVAASTTQSVELKRDSQFTLIGTSQSRIDALDIVTGRKQFAMDLNVPGALPTMVRRPPTINGTVVSVANLAAVRRMEGITDVVVIPTGVAVRGATFGQCIAAADALQVTWGPGSVDGASDDTVLAELAQADQPLPPPPPATTVLEDVFTFSFATGSALETNCAVADVRNTSAEIWGSFKAPITVQQKIAVALGLAPNAVTVHVTEGGGSFGRHLWWDTALEAALVSQAVGKPVKLMWHRSDDFRHGRVHPISTSRVRVAYAGTNVMSLDQRHTSVNTDLTHGVGEIITGFLFTAPPQPYPGSAGPAAGAFATSQNVPYDFGATSQQLTEVDGGFQTTSMRNVWSPNVCCALELMVDRVAAAMGKDPYAFRHEFLTDDRSRAVLDKAAQVGQWGRAMPAGTATSPSAGIASQARSWPRWLRSSMFRPRDAPSPRRTSTGSATSAGAARTCASARPSSWVPGTCRSDSPR